MLMRMCGNGFLQCQFCRFFRVCLKMPDVIVVFVTCVNHADFGHHTVGIAAWSAAPLYRHGQKLTAASLAPAPLSVSDSL